MQAELSGPVADGRAQRIVQEMTEALVDETALRYGIAVVDELKRVVRHPTPYYWTRIDVVQASPGHDVVTDHGIVYGPWLAGVGSRNYPRSRFRGYQHWRKASEMVRRRWPDIRVKILNRYVPRLNGR